MVGFEVFMRHLAFLTDRTSWHLHLFDFDEELDKIAAMHRFLVLTAHGQFEAEYERLMSQPGDGNYDGGDAIWEAERFIGVTPWDIEGHAGLMAITRAVSLAEVTMARMAASHISPSETYVFPKGGLWMRQWEGEFYKTVLASPFTVSANGFSAARELRDLYSHGYGVPASESRRDKLAGALYGEFDSSKAKADEVALGFDGAVYFFGESSRYDTKTRTLVGDAFMSTQANVSKLATRRALEQIRTHIHQAHAAFNGGLRAGLTVSNNKFLKTVDAWWAKQGKP
jgi:hypothetical protein